MAREYSVPVILAINEDELIDIDIGSNPSLWELALDKAIIYESGSKLNLDQPPKHFLEQRNINYAGLFGQTIAYRLRPSFKPTFVFTPDLFTRNGTQFLQGNIFLTAYQNKRPRVSCQKI